MLVKSKEEQELFNVYKKWLTADYIPPHILLNFRLESEYFKENQK